MGEETTMEFVSYLLFSGNRTYIGATTDPDRRLRQHNGELSGGARATKGRKWERALYVYGFPNWTACLQFEWAWKYHSRGFYGLSGKLEGLSRLVRTKQSTSNALPFDRWPSKLGIQITEKHRTTLEKIETMKSLSKLCVPFHSSFLPMSVDMISLSTLAQQVEEQGVMLTQLKTQLDAALAKLSEVPTKKSKAKAKDATDASASEGEGKKKRAPMTEEAKKAMAEKRKATLAAKATVSNDATASTDATASNEEPKAEGTTENKTDSDSEGKKKRAPMTEEAKKAMAEKRKATLAAKAATSSTDAPASNEEPKTEETKAEETNAEEKPKKVVKKKVEKKEADAPTA